MKVHNLLIVEDHPFTRQTLSYEFKKSDRTNLLASLPNGFEAVNFVKTNMPDVILMDIEMPVMNGIDATREIKQFDSNIKIIMLTSHNEKEKVLSAFKSGANGYCVKNAKIEELISVMDVVSDGGVWFDKQIAGFIYDILKNMQNAENEPEKKKTIEDFKITQREQNVLKLVSDGLSNAEIAEQLVISQNTVKNHIASIIQKLAVKDRTQIAVFALKNNLLDN